MKHNKQKLAPVPTPEFRVMFMTNDGSIVMNRHATRDYYFMPWGIDNEFIQYTLKTDAREHGVKIISYTLDKATGIAAIVEWL